MGSELGEASSPLLEGGSGDEDADVEQLSCSIKYRYYTLPRLRYTNAVRCLMLADLLLIVTSWIFIGTSDYFIRSIVHFTWTGSVFDLVLLTIVKVTTLFMLYSKLEDVTLQQIQEPYEPHLQRKKANLHTAIISLSFLSLIYSVVKGSFILYIMKTRPSYTPLHLSEYMISISAIVFGLLSFLLGCLSYKAMRRLKVMRITHHLDEELQEVDKDGKPVKSAVNFSRLFDLIKYEWPLLVIALICTVISVASTTTAPLYFGKVIDASQKSMADLNRTVLILLLVYVGGAIASMFRAWCYELIGQRLVAKLRVDIFKTIINQEIAFFDTNRTGELTNRLSSDTQVVQNLLTVNMSLLIRQTLSIIGSLVFMLVLNAKLTGVLLSVVPIVSLAAVQYGSFVKKIRKLYQDRLADASSTAEEAISGIRTVRSFAREEKTGDIYSDNIDKSYQQGKKLAIAEGGFNGLIGFISYGAVSLVLWYGGKLVIEKKITAGILTSFILYTLNVAVAFGTFSSLYGQFMQAVGASVRIFELRDRKPTVANTGDLEIINLNEGIEFKDVKFTYPSRPDNQVLKGISFKVNHGEMVAVVGPSGGGKSTMVNLIERFYDPDGGSIYLGNTDVRLLNANWFRRQLAMVGQEPILFATSIRDNIAYGKDATIEQIEKVARSANAHEFIADFTEGYDTMVGERGVRLSGGQKQRVAIARALLMDPAVLLLDEATSALDAESEHLVQDAIDRAMNNRTVLVIAHRLSTVRQASKVIVIDDGEIAEQGTHDELIAKDGVYKKLVLRQLMAVDNASSAPEDLAAADNHIGIDGDHNSMPDTEQ